MTRMILTIDQTPCRASYGLKTQQAFRRDTLAYQKQVVRENIDRFVAEGNRMAAIETKENAIAEISADKNYSDAPEVVLGWIERPSFEVKEATGAFINIFV